MVEHCMNGPGLDERRDQYRRHTNAELIEGVFLDMVIGRHGCGWNYVVIESAVLIIQNHQQALVPQCVVASNGVVHIRNEPLALKNVMRRMIVRSPWLIVWRL